VKAEPETPLLYVLRNDLDLRGPRFGCGLGQCGACTVIIDGKATRSCITPVSTLGSKAVTTLEGLGSIRQPHRIQKAFIDAQAAQCGYCINGMIIDGQGVSGPQSTAEPRRCTPCACRQPVPLWHSPAHCRGGDARGAGGVG